MSRKKLSESNELFRDGNDKDARQKVGDLHLMNPTNFFSCK